MRNKMTTIGDLNFYENIGQTRLKEIFDSPFCEMNPGSVLMQIGIIMNLLSPPPAKLLDMGCGLGWTSCFLAKSGYNVTGQDICEDAIYHANQNKKRYDTTNLNFVTGDFETLEYFEEFDCALFFSSLHHATDEKKAINAAYNALKPGGILIASEPGEGHEVHENTINEKKLYGTTEKDMPPHKIIKFGIETGFKEHNTYLNSFSLMPIIKQNNNIFLSILNLIRMHLIRNKNGIVVLKK